MSKVTITFDTAESSLEVNVDGKTLSNVTNIYIYQPLEVSRYDKGSIEIGQYMPAEEGGLNSYTRLCASEGNDLEPKGVQGNYLHYTGPEDASFLQKQLNTIFEKMPSLFKNSQ